MRGVAASVLALCLGGVIAGSVGAGEGDEGPAGENTALPSGINTSRGWMSVESRYVPGVVRSEIGGVTQDADALKAQAVAARTYLLRYLNAKGMGATVPIGTSFQTWKSDYGAVEVEAAKSTAGVVMTFSGLVIYSNYVSGAKVDSSGQPPTPASYGYCSDVEYWTWDAMRDAFRNGRRFNSGNYWCGSGNSWAWTELYVTPGNGQKTLQNNPDDRNRGAMGQWKAKFLGEAGWEFRGILRHFYNSIEIAGGSGGGGGGGGGGGSGPGAVEVTASTLNVRAGPGTGYTDIGDAHSGERYWSTESSGEWKKIYFDGGTGWIHASYVKGATGGTVLTVTATTLNVRGGPGTSYAIEGEAHQGEKYVLVGRSGDWERIWFDGRALWVHGGYTTDSPFASEDPGDPPIDPMRRRLSRFEDL